MQVLVNAFSLLFAKIAAVVGWIGDLAKAVFLAAWDFAKDGVSWCVEQAMTTVTAQVQAVDVGSITQHVNAWGSVPANVLEVCSALGLGTCFAIITTAIGIRLVLQLIPFTRLGS